MKQILLVFILSGISLITSAQIELSVQENINLLSKKDNYVFDFIQHTKKYSFVENEAGMDKFSRHTLLGDFRMQLLFKKSVLNSIGHVEMAHYGESFITSLKEHGFEFSDKNKYTEDNGLYIGCFYRYEKLISGIFCTIIRSPMDENVLWIVFGKIT